jgi:hypothetical protein
MEYMRYVDNFNSNLRILVRDLAKRYPNDAIVFRMQKRVMTVISMDPLLVIKDVGSKLYKYREQIYAADETFFLENSFDAELKAAASQEKADMISYLIPRVKELVRSLPAAEKTEYIELVVSLLDDYIEFIAALHVEPSMRAQ